jgi:hypothetical protein
VDDATRERISGSAPNQPGNRQLMIRACGDQVAKPATAQHAGISDYADVRED